MVINGQIAAGVTVPDTKLARDATELVRDDADRADNHPSRGRISSAASCRLARNRGLSWDPEFR